MLSFVIFLDWSYNVWFVLTGKRPFGVSLLYMGWDKHYGFQLYQSDPSGNYGGWKATCIGNNSAVSLENTADDGVNKNTRHCYIWSWRYVWCIPILEAFLQ